MACTESLSVSIDPTCEGLKKEGGLSPYIYVGAVRDLDSVTYDATDGFVTAIAFATGKQAVKISGKQKKNSYTEPIQDEGEGNVPIFQQNLEVKVYHSTQAERNAIQNLVNNDRLFCIFEGRDGKFMIMGLAKNGQDLDAWGAKVTGGDDPSGINLNDENAQALTFTAEMTHKALIFGEGNDNATNRTALEALLTPAT